MGDQRTSVNSGDEATNAPPSPLNLDPAAQFRTLSQRLEDVANQVARLEKPKEFRLADLLNLGVIVIGILLAVITGWSLKDRIDDLVKGQIATETRLSGQLSAAEARLGGRIDRLDDRVAKLGERTATIGGGSRQAR